MKRFLGFVIKEFRHIFRDTRTLVILFGLPVIMIILFGFVVTNELKDVKVGVLDLSRDVSSENLLHELFSSGYFIRVEDLESEKDIEEVFRSGAAQEVIVIGPRFGESLVREKKAAIHIIADASNANTAQLAANYTRAIISGWMLRQAGGTGLPWQVEISPRMYYNEEMKGVHMFVPGLMAMILMLISALMTSITITREKETGTMEALLVSPLRPMEIILGKVSPYVLLSFINAVTIIILGYFVFRVPMAGSLLLLLAECMLYITLALSLGVFISTVAKSQQMAMIISLIGLMLPTILLSGFIFPIDNMPRVLQWFSSIMPARWFIIIIKNIMLKGTGFFYVWKETLILLVFTVFFMFNAIKRFKIRLE
ncbi:MAG: ABC transporter permease [Bacteroidota bacterium]